MKQKIKIFYQRVKTKEDWQAFWKEFRKKEKEVRKRNMEFSNAKHEAELRALPIGAKIGYNGMAMYGQAMKLNGRWGKKMKDMRKRMLVDFGEVGRGWSVPYRSLTTNEKFVMGSEKTGRQLGQMFNKVLK